MTRLGAFIIATGLLLSSRTVSAQAPPPLEDFVALASKDEKLSEAAAARLAPVWKDAYAAMIIDLARFFRPAREEAPSGASEDSLGGDEDGQTSRTPGEIGRASCRERVSPRV